MFNDFTFPEGILGCITMGGGGGVVEEYLTIKELAQRLKLSPKTIRNKISSGVFKLGVHYVRPPSLGTRFKWSAIEKWLESERTAEESEQSDDEIPMARGYVLGRAPRDGTKIAEEKRTERN
jgi:predicted DNA-binding transcriptional regulator AlpA